MPTSVSLHLPNVKPSAHYMTFKITELVTLSHYKTLIVYDLFFFENIRPRSCTHTTQTFTWSVSDPQILLSCKNEHNRCSVYHVTLWLCDYFVRKQEKREMRENVEELVVGEIQVARTILQRELMVQCEKHVAFLCSAVLLTIWEIHLVSFLTLNGCVSINLLNAQ